MKKIIIIMVFLSVSYVAHHISPVIAYTLPYPSYMPGNTIYKVSRVIDSLKAYWYFGSIAQTKYYLFLSDKYLVEAKTLFEYKQYLLAVSALDRSADAWKKIFPNLANAQKEGKDVSILKQTIKNAEKEHLRIIEGIKLQVPEIFLWSPEKDNSTELHLHAILDTHTSIKKNLVTDL